MTRAERTFVRIAALGIAWCLTVPLLLGVIL